MDIEGCAEAGRAGSPFKLRRAFSGAERFIVLMRSVFAKMECWLNRRGEFWREAEERRRGVVEVFGVFGVLALLLRAVIIGVAAAMFKSRAEELS